MKTLKHRITQTITTIITLTIMGMLAPAHSAPYYAPYLSTTDMKNLDQGSQQVAHVAVLDVTVSGVDGMGFYTWKLVCPPGAHDGVKVVDVRHGPGCWILDGNLPKDLGLLGYWSMPTLDASLTLSSNTLSCTWATLSIHGCMAIGTYPVPAHNFFSGYNAATGYLSESRPIWSDIDPATTPTSANGYGIAHGVGLDAWAALLAPSTPSIPYHSGVNGASNLTLGSGLNLTAGTLDADMHSFNSRVGAVTPQSGDYSFSLISGSVTPAQLPTGTPTTIGAVFTPPVITPSHNFIYGYSTGWLEKQPVWNDIDNTTLPITLGGYGITDGQPLSSGLSALTAYLDTGTLPQLFYKSGLSGISTVNVGTGLNFSAGTVAVNWASPALTGSPTAPTQTSTDNSTLIATDAFVQSVGLGKLTTSDLSIATRLSVPWIGNGITDNSTACTHMMANELASGGTVIFPAGNYVYAGCVLPNAPVRFMGLGHNVTFMTLKASAGTFMLATNKYVSNATGTDQPFLVDGIDFQGNSAAQSTDNALIILRTRRSEFMNVWFDDVKGWGLLLTAKSANGTCLAGAMGDNVFSYNHYNNASRGGWLAVDGGCGVLADFTITHSIFNANAVACPDRQFVADRWAGALVTDNKMFGSTGCGNVSLTGGGGLSKFDGNALDLTTDTSSGATDIVDVILGNSSGTFPYCSYSANSNSFKYAAAALPGSSTNAQMLQINNNCAGAINAVGDVFMSTQVAGIKSIVYAGSNVSSTHLQAHANTFSANSPAPTDTNIELASTFASLLGIPNPLNYLGATTPATDNVPYYNSSSSMSTTSFTSTGRSLVGQTSTANIRSFLSLVVGTNIEAWNSNLDTLATNAGGSLTGLNATQLTLGTIPNARISALPNANLANSTITISGHSLALGGTLNLVVGDISGAAVSGANGDITNLTALANGTCSSPALSWGAAYGFIYDNTNGGVAVCNNTAELGWFGSTGWTQAIPGGGSSLDVLMGEGTVKYSAQRYDASSTSATYECEKARGTITSPVVPINGDNICFMTARVFVGSGTFLTSADIGFSLTETATIDATHLGTKIVMRTTPIGSGTKANTLTLQSSGGVSVGAAVDKGIDTFNAGTIYENGTSLALKYAPINNPTFTGNVTEPSVTVTANGAASTPAVVISGTPYTAGSATTNYPLWYADCSGSTNPTSWSTAGTSFGINTCTGFTGNLMDFHVNGAASVFSVSSGGSIVMAGNLTLAAGGGVFWTGRSLMTSPADGDIKLTNNAGTSFGSIKLGGTTSSFPAIKRNATALNFRLADDSADASITAASSTFSVAIINTGITSDVTHVDSSVCQDTITHQFYSGSGTLGVCLGTSTRTAKYDFGTLPGLSAVMLLKPQSFKYKVGYGYDPHKLYYGLMAEDLDKVMPKLTGHDKNGKPNSVDLIGLVPVLVKSIQEEQFEIKALQAANIQLNMQLVKLKIRLHHHHHH